KLIMIPDVFAFVINHVAQVIEERRLIWHGRLMDLSRHMISDVLLRPCAIYAAGVTYSVEDETARFTDRLVSRRHHVFQLQPIRCASTLNGRHPEEVAALTLALSSSGG